MLPAVSRIIILENGEISGDGTYEDLNKTNSVFLKLETDSMNKNTEHHELKSVEKPKRERVKKEKMKEVHNEQALKSFDWEMIKVIFSYSSFHLIPVFGFFMIINIILTNWRLKDENNIQAVVVPA